VAWALRVVYFHLWIDERERSERPLNRPETMDLAGVIGSDESSWWQRYQRAREHPFTAYVDAGFRVGAGQAEALAFMREFLPPEAIDGIGRADCVAWNRYVHDALRMMHAKSVEERKEYQKHMATLAASLANFEGERERLLCSEDPDIIIRDAVRNRGIVYFTANYMKDNQASEGACRTFVIDGLSFLGDVYGASSAGRYDWYFCADEVATFITTDLIPFMSQGRGAGVHTILLGQNGIDYQVALGDKAKADQLQGVTRTRITLCTANQQDARDFAEASGKRIIRVRRGFGLNTSRADGNLAAHTIGHYSQSSNESWDDKEVERVPQTALLQLPTGQAFVRSTDALHLVLQGQLPEPRCNILREYGLLSYHDGEQVPAITANHLRELELTNRRLEEGIFPGRSYRPQAGQAVPADRQPQDRAADLAFPRATGGAPAPPREQTPAGQERAGSPTRSAATGATPAGQEQPPTLAPAPGGDDDEVVVR
jgi:5-carboxymethyl-2-hydroxymuconate isomerase